MLPQIALAITTLPDPLCDFPGCTGGPKPIVVDTVIPELARIALNFTAALSLLFIFVAGGRLLLCLGKEEELENAKKTVQWALVGLVVALTSHRIVTAIVTQNYLSTGDAGDQLVIGVFAAILGGVATVLNVTFVLAIVLGGMRMLMARGKDDEVTKGKKAVIYALVGAILINVAPFLVKAVMDI